MKLMGIGKLHALATSGDRALAGAAASLRAELSSAEWADAEDAADTYPNARFNGHRIKISLPADHCAVISVNYRAAVALVEFAGPNHAHKFSTPSKARKQA
jgi:hypothetical protein